MEYSIPSRQLAGRNGLSLELVRRSMRGIRDWQHGGRCDARQRRQPREQLLLEPRRRRCIRVVARRQCQAERHQVRWIEAEIGREQAREAANEQAGSDEQDEGERRLNDDERVASATPAGVVRRAAAAVGAS